MKYASEKIYGGQRASMSRAKTPEEVAALTLRLMPWLRSPDPRVRAAGQAAFNAYPSATSDPLDPDEFARAIVAGDAAARAVKQESQ